MILTHHPDTYRVEETKTFRYRLAIILGLVAVIVIVGVWAGGGASSDLRLLRSDPMSTVELSQASESFRRERDRGTTLGIQSPVTIDRTFLPTGDASAVDVANEAVEVAQENGWVMTETSPDYYQGKRRVGNRAIGLEISYAPNRDTVSLTLSIR